MTTVDTDLVVGGTRRIGPMFNPYRERAGVGPLPGDTSEDPCGPKAKHFVHKDSK